ncbi:MAG: hypothetical protein OEZ16_00770 [Chromatiales bacterium]|nr:hypothetical protein [Chromatiales bacterium]
MEDTDIEINDGEEVFESVASSLLIDGLGDLIGLIAMFAILISVVRLFRSTNAPGVNYMFYSMVLTVIGFIIPFLSFIAVGDEGHWVFDVILNIYMGLIAVLGAYGFWLLTTHVIENHAKNA